MSITIGTLGNNYNTMPLNNSKSGKLKESVSLFSVVKEETTKEDFQMPEEDIDIGEMLKNGLSNLVNIFKPKEQKSEEPVLDKTSEETKAEPKNDLDNLEMANNFFETIKDDADMKKAKKQVQLDNQTAQNDYSQVEVGLA